MGMEVITSNPGELPSIPEPAGRVQLPLPPCVQAAPSAHPCPIKEASSPKEKPSWAESQPPPCETPLPEGSRPLCCPRHFALCCVRRVKILPHCVLKSLHPGVKALRFLSPQAAWTTELLA